MTNLDDLEDLLHRGEKEKAYELIKEDKGITAEILINEGISFGIIGNYKLIPLLLIQPLYSLHCKF